VIRRKTRGTFEGNLKYIIGIYLHYQGGDLDGRIVFKKILFLLVILLKGDIKHRDF
jgi:hypothetical protein